MALTNEKLRAGHSLDCRVQKTDSNNGEIKSRINKNKKIYRKLEAKEDFDMA